MEPKEIQKILVVDDTADTREVIKRNLVSQGYQVFMAPGVGEGIQILESNPIDLVITDYKMPKVTGMDLVKHVAENYKDTAVIMITGFASIESAVQAVKNGAEEYLTKPFTDDELFSAVDRALEKMSILRIRQKQERPKGLAVQSLLGESEAMCNIYKEIAKTASTNASVILTGESGTGKELVARAIHYNSPRSSAPFVAVNCGGIPENLIESELFGHSKGAFTGAYESRAGFFQTADGGTIFLDEVSETSLAMQVKLLRVLQEREVFMVGSDKARQVNVRIIAASNKDLSILVKKGLFREDLFYRLNVININLPPLRERDNDITLLIHHFAKRFSDEMGRDMPKFTDEALKALNNYHWPGNVRELENVIQRLVVMTEGDCIEAPDLPSLMRFSALHKVGINRSLAEVVREHIYNVMASVNGNKSRAAEILNIDRKTLWEKLKNYENSIG